MRTAVCWQDKEKLILPVLVYDVTLPWMRGFGLHSYQFGRLLTQQALLYCLQKRIFSIAFNSYQAQFLRNKPWNQYALWSSFHLWPHLALCQGLSNYGIQTISKRCACTVLQLWQLELNPDSFNSTDKAKSMKCSCSLVRLSIPARDVLERARCTANQGWDRSQLYATLKHRA